MNTPALPVKAPVLPAPKPAETAGMRALRLALAQSRVHHTLSIAQRVGIYPA